MHIYVYDVCEIRVAAVIDAVARIMTRITNLP